LELRGDPDEQELLLDRGQGPAELLSDIAEIGNSLDATRWGHG
jgi:hypothetical protein